jgi:hypothetical protein
MDFKTPITKVIMAQVWKSVQISLNSKWEEKLTQKVLVLTTVDKFGVTYSIFCKRCTIFETMKKNIYINEMVRLTKNNHIISFRIGYRYMNEDRSNNKKLVRSFLKNRLSLNLQRRAKCLSYKLGPVFFFILDSIHYRLMKER